MRKADGMNWKAVVADTNALDHFFQVQVRTGCKIAARQYTGLIMANKLNNNQMKVYLNALQKLIRKYSCMLTTNGHPDPLLSNITYACSVSCSYRCQLRGPGYGDPFDTSSKEEWRRILCTLHHFLNVHHLRRLRSFPRNNELIVSNTLRF